MRIDIIITALAALCIPSAAWTQDIAAGERSFKKGQPCHSIGESATKKTGPPPNGLAGRKTGTAEGYDYSQANKNAGIVWDDNTFKEYIQNPTAKIPGTKMAFGGIKNDKEIADLWEYLKSFGADGKKK